MGGPAEVGVEVVKEEAVSITTLLPGRTSAYTVAEIRPQVGGIIQKRTFTEGADVKAGEVLYQIDSATFQAAHDAPKLRSRAAKPRWPPRKPRPSVTAN